LSGFEVNLQMIVYGYGTAPKELNLLGMKNGKAVIISVIKRKHIKKAMETISDKFDKLRNVVTLHTIKACESITDFLENSKYAKLLKKTRVLNKNKSKKLEQKKSTKHSRTEAKEQIKQGIEEYNATHTYSSLCKGCMYIDRCPSNDKYNNFK
jgi:hypothetical protein